MKFRIQISLEERHQKRGNSRQVNAALRYNEKGLLKNHLGSFLYYHFLRDFFEDISKFHRVGDIAFCKPVLEDLCITWSVPDDARSSEIKSEIINGLLHASIVEKQKYFDKYSIDPSLHYLNDNGFSDQMSAFEVGVETRFCTKTETAATTDLGAKMSV